MKNYEKEIREAAKKYCSQDDYLGLSGRIFNSMCFTAGVNSEIAAKIREDEAVEFKIWCEENEYLHDNVNEYNHSVRELYAIFLTENSK